MPIDITFVVKNNSSINRAIKVFNTKIDPGQTLDLMKVPGITEEIIRFELTKGNLRNLLAGGSLIILSSTVNFSTDDPSHNTFLTSIGLTGSVVQEVGTSSGGSGGGNVFIYRDSEPNPTGNVYSTWVDAYNARQNVKGTAIIEIDGSINTPGTITAGTYDLSDTIIVGNRNNQDDGLLIADNTTITNLCEVKDLYIVSLANTMPSVIVNNNPVVVKLRNASLIASGPNSFWSVNSGGLNFYMYEGSYMEGNGGAAVLANLQTSSGEVILYQSSQLGSFAFAGSGGNINIQLDASSSNSDYNPTFTGSDYENLIDNALSVSYSTNYPDDWGTVPANVKTAFDQLVPAYCMATVSGPQSSNIGVGDHIQFSVQQNIGHLITLNTSGSYNTALPNSVGVFNLLAGHGYKLDANFSLFDGTYGFIWWDVVSNQALPGAVPGGNLGGAGYFNSTAIIPASYFGANSSINVRLKILFANGNTFIGENTGAGFMLPWAIIQSIG